MTISPYAIPGIQRDDYFIQKACHVFGVKKEDVMSRLRKREVAQCRHALLYFFHKNKGYNHVKAGSVLDRDRATTIHSIKIIENITNEPKDFRDKFDRLMNELKLY